jgi:hypothetical protein
MGAALVAIVAGLGGLVTLAVVGMGRTEGNDVSPIERVAAKMARRAKGMGAGGIAIGAAILLYHVLLLLGALGKLG